MMDATRSSEEVGNVTLVLSRHCAVFDTTQLANFISVSACMREVRIAVSVAVSGQWQPRVGKSVSGHCTCTESGFCWRESCTWSQ